MAEATPPAMVAGYVEVEGRAGAEEDCDEGGPEEGVGASAGGFGDPAVD